MSNDVLRRFNPGERPVWVRPRDILEPTYVQFAILGRVGINQKRISGGQSNEFEFQVRFEFQVSVGESGKTVARVGSGSLQGAAMGEEHLHVDLLMTTMTMMTTIISE